MLASVAANAAPTGAGQEGLAGKGKDGVKLVNKGSGPTAQAGVSVTIQLPSTQAPMWMPRENAPGFSPVAPIYYPDSAYGQLEGLCTSVIESLKNATVDANRASVGPVGSAASFDVLYQGLVDANKEFERFGAGRNRTNAHTMVAVKSALNLARVIKTQLPNFVDVLRYNTAPLQDSIMRRLYANILETNQKLDQQFFGQIRQCRSMNCYIRSLQQYDMFGGNYFANLKAQARSVLNLALDTSKPMGPTLFGAIFTSHAAFEASEMLATSPFAVDFACPVNNLLKVADQLNKAVGAYNPADPQANIKITYAVNTARWKMEAIKSDIGNSFCGQSFGPQWQEQGGKHHGNGGKDKHHGKKHDGDDDDGDQDADIEVNGSGNTIILQQQDVK